MVFIIILSQIDYQGDNIRGFTLISVSPYPMVVSPLVDEMADLLMSIMTLRHRYKIIRYPL